MFTKKKPVDGATPPRSSRARRIARGFIPPVVPPTRDVREGAELIGYLWDRLSDRSRHLAKRRGEDEPPADFETLCRENGLGSHDIQERQALLVRSRRLSWIFMVFALVWGLLGVANLVTKGFSVFAFCLVFVAIPIALLCFAWLFRYSLHLWQLERRQLLGARDFFQDHGVLRTIRF